MKKLTSLFIAFIFISLMACNESDDNTAQDNGAGDALTGAWNLFSSDGGITGQYRQYPEGAITWHFNIENQTVTVINSTDEEVVSGTYPYEIVVPQFEPSEFGQCQMSISLNGSDPQNCLDISGDNFTIYGPYPDGTQLTFKR